MSTPRVVRTPQYWLVELDKYDNPKLIDGSHDSPEGCNKAAYLIKSLGLGKADRNFAIARVELSECSPSSKGVNHSALRTLKATGKFKQ